MPCPWISLLPTAPDRFTVRLLTRLVIVALAVLAARHGDLVNPAPAFSGFRCLADLGALRDDFGDLPQQHAYICTTQGDLHLVAVNVDKRIDAGRRFGQWRVSLWVCRFAVQVRLQRLFRPLGSPLVERTGELVLTKMNVINLRRFCIIWAITDAIDTVGFLTLCAL